MSVQEIESAITRLSNDDLREFAHWFEEFQAAAWDRRIEQDVAAGRFDAILQRVNEQIDTGQYRPL